MRWIKLSDDARNIHDPLYARHFAVMLCLIPTRRMQDLNVCTGKHIPIPLANISS